MEYDYYMNIIFIFKFKLVIYVTNYNQRDLLFRRRFWKMENGWFHFKNF